MKRWVLEGTDYVYPRTTNKILEAYLKAKGVAAGRHHDQLHAVRPFRLADRRRPTSRSSARPARRPPWSRPSTATPTCRSTRNSATRASRPRTFPVVAFSVGEEELAGLDTKPLVGHLAAWNYFESIKTPANKAFIKQWHDFIKNPKRATNDPMEAHYIGFNMWVKAVEKAGTTEVDKVLAALPGLEAPNLTGGIAKMLPNHHITKPVYIGEVRATASSTSSGRPTSSCRATPGPSTSRARRT